MEYPVSRVVVQRLCDERAELVPYLSRIVESLERHSGFYAAKLAELLPVEVIEELHDWLKGHRGQVGGRESLPIDSPEELAVGLEILARMFPEYADEFFR
jgi:hypothetical protein